MPSNSLVEINSKVNEIFIKTTVTQKLKNDTENPLELKIYIDKKPDLIFSSFTAKIGDSILVKSKVIKKSKAEEKYSDSIASGNAAIFVSTNLFFPNRIMINLGNIPPKQEVIFISEFIEFISSSDSYEFELFRNLPIFKNKDTFIENSEIKGTIEINTKNKITKIEKKFLSEDKLNIIEEKFLDENKYDYSIKYKYKNLSSLNSYDPDDYIPSNKICFKKENNTPFSVYQNSSKENEINYIIQYKNITKEKNNENAYNTLNPSLFIFLIDQSGSMSGSSMEMAKEALILFLQSLPAGSYYQIIGFGSDYEKYDKKPKEYIQKNIKESIKFIETLNANKGGTNIYDPLKDIYNSTKDYNNIKLPKNIFLLTDGEIEDKTNTLNIIEENSNEFFVFSIGIGNYFDEDLIKNAGILGKGNYNFCTDIKDLNEIIVNDIKNCSKPFKHDFEFTSNLDEKNLFKINNGITVLKENQIVNMKYIIENKVDIDKNIKLDFKYKLYNTKKQKDEEFKENYEINSEEIQSGEELSKLIINNYLLNNKDLNEEEKTKLALKYQILTDYTSLFAEVELSGKISEEMKKEIIEDGKNNEIFIREKNIEEIYQVSRLLNDRIKEMEKISLQGCALSCSSPPISYTSINEKSPSKSSKASGIGNFFKSIGNSILGFFAKKESNSDDNNKNDIKEENKIENTIEINSNNDESKENEITNEINNYNYENSNNKNKKDTNKIMEIKKNKEINIKEIINEQNFVEGFWEMNVDVHLVHVEGGHAFDLIDHPALELLRL